MIITLIIIIKLITLITMIIFIIFMIIMMISMIKCCNNNNDNGNHQNHHDNHHLKICLIPLLLCKCSLFTTSQFFLLIIHPSDSKPIYLLLMIRISNNCKMLFKAYFSCQSSSLFTYPFPGSSITIS